MRHNTFTKTLWDNRKIFAVWAVITGLLAMGYASAYPQVSGNMAANLPKALNGFGLANLSTAADYLQGSVFGLLVPLLVIFYGAATGARMISADEESGYLDLLLAHPLGRTSLALQRFTALAAGAGAIAATVWIAMLAIRPSAELTSISIAEFAAQCLNVALLSITFGALAIALGAALGLSRALVFGITAGAGVIAYIANGLAPQLGIDSLQYLTPFHYYIGNEPLKNGFHPAHIGILFAATALLVTLGAWRFTRRDIAT